MWSSSNNLCNILIRVAAWWLGVVTCCLLTLVHFSARNPWHHPTSQCPTNPSTHNPASLQSTPTARHHHHKYHPSSMKDLCQMNERVIVLLDCEYCLSGSCVSYSWLVMHLSDETAWTISKPERQLREEAAQSKRKPSNFNRQFSIWY